MVDDGFKAAASRFVKWNQDGTIDKDVWAATGGGYRDAFSEFANGKVVLYLSGSWQVRRMEKEIGNGFDWAVMPNPCGTSACSGMPGGAAFVAFKQTKSPKEVAAFLDYMAQPAVYAKWMGETANVGSALFAGTGSVASKSLSRPWSGNRAPALQPACAPRLPPAGTHRHRS